MRRQSRETEPKSGDPAPVLKVMSINPAAMTCHDYADMLRDRDGPGDQEKTVKPMDESLALSRELGMRPLMERVLPLQATLKV